MGEDLRITLLLVGIGLVITAGAVSMQGLFVQAVTRPNKEGVTLRNPDISARRLTKALFVAAGILFILGVIALVGALLG